MGNGKSSTLNIHDVVNSLFSIAENIIPSIVQEGIEPTDNVVNGVDEVVLDSWMNQNGGEEGGAGDAETRDALKTVLG